LIVESNAILPALFLGFKNIKDHTLTDITQQIEAQKRDLEAKLALISSNNLAALQQERRGYEAKIAEIDSKIRHICEELGIDVGSGAEAKKGRRTRMSGAAIDAKIVEALTNAPEGLSQIGISETTGVSYASVVNWLKENAAKVRTEGERKGKRVFLRLQSIL
jgi:tRNA U55 pseudouridine synthase TruB